MNDDIDEELDALLEESIEIRSQIVEILQRKFPNFTGKHSTALMILAAETAVTGNLGKEHFLTLCGELYTLFHRTTKIDPERN